jgi:hypothetical protein
VHESTEERKECSSIASLAMPYFSSTFYSGNAITNPTEFAGVLGQWVHVHLYDKFLHDL